MTAEYERHVISRVQVVRDGISLLFVELDDGTFHVSGNRRTRPFLRAFFVIEDTKTAKCWRDDGVVPAGETADLYKQLQDGTWPEPLPGSG